MSDCVCYAENRVQKCHSELQNVCKAKKVFRLLETFEVLLSVCQFSALATGKATVTVENGVYIV